MFISILQLIAVIATIAIGLFSLFAPTKIEGFTGLKPVGGRGVAEIRAIFGGAFIGLGLVPLLLNKSVAYPMLGIVYLAIGLTRVVTTIFLDKSRESSNLISVASELVLGVLFLI
jgi:hypothetical protein